MNTEASPQMNQSELDRIDNLPISIKLKAKIRLVHENLHATKFGFPEYRPKENTSTSRMFVGGKLFSIWAFLFGPLYYLAKGMWRKSLVFIGINIVLAVVVGMITDEPAVVQAPALFVNALCSQCAYHDLYRKLVKNEVFWW